MLVKPHVAVDVGGFCFDGTVHDTSHVEVPVNARAGPAAWSNLSKEDGQARSKVITGIKALPGVFNGAHELHGSAGSIVLVGRRLHGKGKAMRCRRPLHHALQQSGAG